VVTYLPDHEPALVADAGRRSEWRTGHALAARTDLLIHDAQYTPSEYGERVGWGPLRPSITLSTSLSRSAPVA
jgi:hypothetical protein